MLIGPTHIWHIQTRAAAKSLNEDTAVRLRPAAEKSEEKDKPETRVEPAAVPPGKADDKEKEKASEDEERRANLYVDCRGGMRVSCRDMCVSCPVGLYVYCRALGMYI
jgi:hypothetical protein